MKKEQQTDMAKVEEKAKQMQQLKKYGFFVLIGIIFLGILYMIFSPWSADKKKTDIGKGFNTEIPDPNNSGIIGDKQKAYEQEALMRNRNSKRKSLEDFSALVGAEKEAIAENVVDITQQGSEVEATPTDNAIKKSTSSYKNINETLTNFYDIPATEIDENFLFELDDRITALEGKTQQESLRKNTVDEQLAIVEKSYQMAAKYMPNTGQQSPSGETTLEAGAGGSSSQNSGKGKNPVSVIKQVHEQTVSALAQDVPNHEFIASFYKPRNIGFNTMDSPVGVSEKNTISAIIHDDQTLISGQSVRLRLSEPMIAGTTIIPANSLLTGTAALQGERLGISISSIEIGGAIIPVEIAVYDSDGQYGIFIPNSLELDAAKEIAANMGNSVGTSISITNDAGEQVLADLSKGAIQGVSQYMQKKIRMVKVNLKSGYRVLLLPKQN